MAASGRGLRRAVSACPCPARRRAHWEARGRLKPEYDAVVIGAGNAAEPELRVGGQLHSEAWRDPSPTFPVFWAQAGQEWGQREQGPGAGSGVDWLGGLEQVLALGVGLPTYSEEEDQAAPSPAEVAGCHHILEKRLFPAG